MSIATNQGVNQGATVRLTVAQAIVRFLTAQNVERDGFSQRFFAGCFGIFGHGNVAGMGQALQQYPALRYYQTRNEQAMVHTATAFAKHKNRLQTLVCTSSIGPGATNMITGAATATINRLPVLLLPGDIFARRNVAPVLQQLESEHSQDISVNDAFRPVSRYWDRINRPDQIITSLPEVMRVLTSPAETGAVTLSLPQDVQTEAYDYPVTLFRDRVWRVPRNRPDLSATVAAWTWIRDAKKPMIIAGGGVLYSEATEALRRFVEQSGIPVGETMAGKGSLRYDHPLNLGAVGTTGTSAANQYAREADLIVGIGTRYSDFTTASKTQFQHPDLRFVNINVAEFDAYKHHALPLVGDARATLEELMMLFEAYDYKLDGSVTQEAKNLHTAWEEEVDRIYSVRLSPLPSQGELIGAVNDLGDPDAVMVGAAGSLPGDLHKLWRARHNKQYHMEYGFSCMGYEIAGGLGIKMADPSREVYVMIGDGSYLMLSAEIVTSIQEGYKLTIVLMDNSGYKSIGSLSRSLGQTGFGTRYVFPAEGQLPDDSVSAVAELPVDLASNARSLGAHVIECESYDTFVEALAASKLTDRTTVIHVRNDRYVGVPGYNSWWDVPVAEVSESDTVNAARRMGREEGGGAHLPVMRDFDGFQLITVADDPTLADRMQELIDAVWPSFVTQSASPKGHTLPFEWMGVYKRWPHLQFVLIDPTDRSLVAACNALTLAWDGPAEELPDEGWNWVMHQARLDLEAGRTPTMGSALSITLDPTRRGQNLSSVAVRAMKLLIQETGVKRFFAPVRPTTKARYPITPMAEFIRWTNGEGLPLDPWMRVHARLGARVIKACNRSQPLGGSVAEWEKWLDFPLPTSGEYVGPGLLTTLQVDREADEAVCWEPNVWMEHPLA